MSDAGRIIGVVVLGVVALVGVLIFSIMAGVAFDLGLDTGSEEIENPQTNTAYDISGPDDGGYDVSASQENAIYLAGDGYVDGGVSDDWYDGHWTICTTNELDADANEQATYNTFAYDDETVLVEYHDGDWRAMHYVDDESATAEINAAGPGELESVCVSWNNIGEELEISDGDQTDTAGLTATNPDRQVANNWFGTVDEVRIINEDTDEEFAAEYADDPVAALDADHEGRYMFNEGEGDETYVYYSASHATLVSAEWTDGVSAPVLEEGVDYEQSNGQVTVLEGSYLDGSPTMVVSWDGGPLSGSLSSIYGGLDSAFQFVPIIMLVILASVLLGIVQRMRV